MIHLRDQIVVVEITVSVFPCLEKYVGFTVNKVSRQLIYVILEPYSSPSFSRPHSTVRKSETISD